MIAYKCVSNMSSYAGLNLPPDYRIKYKVGEFVTGYQGSPLFVFKTLQDARNFEPRVTKIIYECEVTNPRRVKYIFNILYPAYYLYKFYKNKAKKRKLRHVMIPPKGTLAVDSVKLIKQVES